MAAMHSSSSSMALALLPILLILPTLASASRALDNGEELLMLGRFHGWMARHGRWYATEEEKLLRFEIYRSNMEFIAAANQDPRMSYRLGETPFTDLTHDEFVAMYTGNNAADPSDGEEMITTRVGPVNGGGGLPGSGDEPPHRVDVTALPAFVDWSTKGFVSPVEFQKNCLSTTCWTFVAAATMESAKAIKTGGAPPVLSEQQLVDCDYYDDGCDGGWMDTAFQWVIDNGGITSAAAYPYTGKNGTCRTGMRVEVKLRGYKMLPRRNEAAIMAAVALQPVAVALDGNDTCFQHYFGGVYDGKCFTADGVYEGGACSESNLNHAVALVGYGTMPDGTKYWIAKNSWSHLWGDKGFVYLLRDLPPYGLCGLAERPSYPII